jgi:D-alanyl-D-alanine carboxypeptidase
MTTMKHPSQARSRQRFTPSCEPLEGRALQTAAAASLPPAVAAIRQQNDAYAAAVKRVMEEFRIPGAVAGVWIPGKRAWTGAQGVADVETGRPISTADRFPIRSITKSYVATLILRLARAGRLSLDDPISDYVSGIPNGDRITLSQLAGMRSGIKNYTESPIFLEKFVADLGAPWTPRQVVDTATPLSPVFEPDAEYNYSNTNTFLLGMVAERVTGRPLGALFQAHFIRPLGLRDTSYPQDATIPSPHPTPYDVDPATGEMEEIPPVNLSSLGAAGGLVSSLDDLRRWGRALGSGVLVGPRYQRIREQTASTPNGGPEYDVYGLGMGRLKGWWGHTGEALGFQAATFYNPRTRAVIAVAVNSSQATNVATEIFKALAAAVASQS